MWLLFFSWQAKFTFWAAHQKLSLTKQKQKNKRQLMRTFSFSFSPPLAFSQPFYYAAMNEVVRICAIRVV